MSSNPAAVARGKMVPITIVSNDGASSSRDSGKTKAHEIAEPSSPRFSWSSTSSEELEVAAYTSSVYSDHEEPSTCQLLARGATGPLAHEPRLMPVPHAAPATDSPQQHVPSASARGESLKPTSQPAVRSSLRLSLASFVSRLFRWSKKWQQRTALPTASEDDRKESERVNQFSARQAFPLSLPNQLLLCSRTLHHPNERGIQIIESCSNQPFLVGYRERSHLSSNTRDLSLCVGDRWYGSWTDPFLKAHSNKYLITVAVCDHQLATAPETTIFKAWSGASDRNMWRFTVGVPDSSDNTTTMQEDFEWYTRRLYRLEGDQRHRRGSYLIQVSTQKVVATLERRLWRKRSSVVSRGFVVSFLGSGQKYGGLWKIVVFAIGLCGQ